MKRLIKNVVAYPWYHRVFEFKFNTEWYRTKDDKLGSVILEHQKDTWACSRPNCEYERHEIRTWVKDKQ